MKIKIKLKRNKYIIDLLCFFIACTLCPLLLYISDNDRLASLGFLFGGILIILRYKHIESLAFYFLSISLEYHVLYVSIVGDSALSIMGLIKIYYIFLACWHILKKRHVKSKYNIISYYFILLVLLYYMLNAFILDTNNGNVSNSAILITIIVFEFILSSRESYKRQFVFAVFSSTCINLICFFYEIAIGRSKYYEQWTGMVRYRGGILRVGGFQEDPNIYGFYMLVMLLILMMPYARSIIGNKVSYVINVLAAITIIMSMSRTAILALIICISIISYYKQKKLRTIYFVLAVVASTIFLFWGYGHFFRNLEVASSNQRIYLDLQAIKYWLSSPVSIFVGIGYGRFQYLTKWLTMNEWLRQLCEYGIIGFLLYGYYYFHSSSFLLFENNNGKKSKRYIGDRIYPIVTLIGIAIISFSLDTYYHYPSWLVPAMTALSIPSIDSKELRVSIQHR